MRWRLIFLLCIPFLSIPIFNISAVADNSLKLRVGLYENQPKIFSDTTGQASGFWPDLINYIAAAEGWEIEYVPGTWTECMQRLENGNIDVMPDVAFTPERNMLFTFSVEPVYTSWSRVYAGKNVDIYSVLDLENKKIAVLKGSINFDGLDGIKQLVKSYNVNCEFIETDSYFKVFELVQSGAADAGVTSKDFGYQHENDFDLVKTSIIFQPSLLYFAFPKDSSLTPHLKERIDTYIKTLKQDNDSVYYMSLDKWMGIKPEDKAVIPIWLIWSLAGIGGLAVLLAGGSIILRAQVRKRTRALTEEIASRNRAEVELSKYRDHLEKLVEERTIELEDKNEELIRANIRLKEMDSLKSIFLASMSHELRTPLNSIIGFTGVMLQGLAGAINDEQRKQLTIVKSSASHLLNLISDVLDISKIEAGRVELSLEEFSLDDLMQDMDQTFSNMAREKGLELTFTMPENVVFYSDKRRVKQILMNLLSNSIKFTEFGSVKVTSTVPEDGYIQLQVTDTGIGIKDEDMAKLFEPFQQVDSMLTKKHEGTGLGLYLTRKLADLLGGNISATSHYGQGSEFTFSLPLKKWNAISPAVPGQAEIKT